MHNTKPYFLVIGVSNIEVFAQEMHSGIILSLVQKLTLFTFCHCFWSTLYYALLLFAFAKLQHVLKLKNVLKMESILFFSFYRQIIKGLASSW